MGKKRKKRKKPEGKRPKKSKGLDKQSVIIVLIAFLLIVLLLFSNQPSDRIIITNLKTEEGDQNYIHFDMKHTFSTEKECFAEITLSQNNRVISSNVESLGFIKPNQVVSKSLLMNFPSEGTDFKIDIDCK